MTNGFCYVSVNEDGEKNVIASAESLLKHMHDAKITIFVDCEIKPKHLHLFDRVIPIESKSDDPEFMYDDAYPNQGLIQKAKYMLESPYDYTIFLDYDMFVTDDVSEIFKMMRERGVELAGVIDEAYVRTDKDVPDCFPRINLGMVAYKKCANIKILNLTYWEYLKKLHSDTGGVGDEQAFAKALYACKQVKYSILPPEYNCRFIFPYILRYKAKILHGRSFNYERLSAKINKDAGTYRVMHEGNLLATHQPIKGFETYK